MKTISSLFLKSRLKYDGTQLSSHFAYKNFNIPGNSVVAFIGPVEVNLSEMVDIEDVINGEAISSDLMLNFIIEIFDATLGETICLQRLFSSIIQDELNTIAGRLCVNREGDDLFYDERKLSVSIATASPVSTMIHTALNIVRSGAPIPVSCLEELDVDPVEFGNSILKRFVEEFEQIRFARVKVNWVS
jgi:hypothetical protein